MKKRFLALILAALMLASLTACGGGSTSSSGSSGSGSSDSGASTSDSGSGAPEYVWKMHLNGTAGELAFDMATYFVDKLTELTDGRVQVDMYGGAALGTTTEVLEGMSAGVADLMCESVGTLAPFTPLANIDAMPYMYSGGYEHFAAMWASDLGHEILDEVGNASGFKLMGSGYRGARVVTATKKMETIEDFKGFKLRAPNLEMYVKTWQWMGSAPTPLAMGETYTAIQQGTVNGQENSILDSKSFSLAEVCKYWILTNHVYSSNCIVMDANKFNALPEDIQAALEEASVYAGEMISQDVLNREDAARAELESQGVEFVEVDNAAFSEYFVGFAEENFPDLADWANQIRAMDPTK